MVAQILWGLGDQFWVLCVCTIGVICVTFGWLRFFYFSAKKERASQPSEDVCKQGKDHDVVMPVEANTEDFRSMGNATHDYTASVLSKPKIFLSYSGAQKPFVTDLYEALERTFQVSVFYDYIHLTIGRSFANQILEAAQECEVAVVVLTEQYLSSKWPMIELATLTSALKSNIKLKILPVFYGLSIHDLNNERMRERWFKVWQEFGNRINVEECKLALKVLTSFNGITYDRNLQDIRSYQAEVVSIILSLAERHHDQYLEAPTQLHKDLSLVSSLVDRMNDMRKVKFFRRQCNHLRLRSLEVSEEIHALLGGSEMNWEQHYPMARLISSLTSMVGCIGNGMELLQLCGDNNDQKAALLLSSLAPHTDSYSQFALVIRDLDWHLDVIRFLLHNPEAAGHQTLTWLSKFSWCEEKCRLVYAEDEPAQLEYVVNKFLEADLERHSHGRQELIAHLVEVEIFSSFLGNRLLGDSTFSNNSQSLPDCFWIPGKLEYKIITDLGAGSFKTVLKCEWSGIEVAIAILAEGWPREKLEAEAVLLARVQHANVVKLIGCNYDEEEQKGFVVTELMERNLRSLINSRRSMPGRNFPFDLPVSIDIVLQIAEALVHVHECGVIYRDLKAENCLVNGKGDAYVVKLTDFGESKLRCSEMGSQFKTRNKGSRAWMAPEVMGNEKDERNYTWSADVYSFGITCYEVFTGEKPFGGIAPKDLKRRVCAGDRPEIPGDCSEGLAELMRKCWAHNPGDRPTFKEIRQSLWKCKLSCTIWESVPIM